MEARPAFHPVYVSGQYLTSEHLNETQDFLWEEEKATRYLLCGNGIADGLAVSTATLNNQLCVKLGTGAGVTNDGYLLQLTPAAKADPNHYYNRAKEITLVLYVTDKGEKGLVEKEKFAALSQEITVSSSKETNAFELFATTATAPDGSKLFSAAGITSASLGSDWLLLGWIDISDAKNDHCQQGDCNTMGTQRNYTTRFFLVKKTDIDQGNSLHAALPLCQVTRIKNLSSVTSNAGFYQKNFDAWTSSLAVISKYFSDGGTDTSLEEAVFVCKNNALIDAWKDAVLKFKAIAASVSKSNCPQYYVSFADDMARGINELVRLYNPFVSRYPVIGKNRIERCVVFGQPGNTGFDKWRYYFIPAVFDEEKAERLDEVRRLLHRVLAMVNTFVLQTAMPQHLKKIKGPLCYPTHKHHAGLLENCSIAAYFDITKNGTNNPLLESWSPVNQLQNIFSYYDSEITARKPLAESLTVCSWDQYNFFRVDGHVGMTKSDAINALSKIINDEGLPVQLLDCDVNYKGPDRWFTWYDTFVLQMEEWVPKLRQDVKVYEFDRLKKIQLKAAQTSYRNVDEITKVANDFYAYANVFYNAKATEKTITLAKKEVRAGVAPREATMVTGIPDVAVNKFKEIVPKENVDQLRKQFNEAIVEQKDLNTKKLVTLKDLQGLEYAGGAPRGGTFVLLHDGAKILGDGCLAHYYRIDQARVWTK